MKRQDRELQRRVKRIETTRVYDVHGMSPQQLYERIMGDNDLYGNRTMVPGFVIVADPPGGLYGSVNGTIQMRPEGEGWFHAGLVSVRYKVVLRVTLQLGSMAEPTKFWEAVERLLKAILTEAPQQQEENSG